MPSRSSPEAHIQADIVKRLRAAGWLVHSIPNSAAGRNAVRQAQEITMGLLPGVADLLAWDRDGWPAYIEVKAPGGRQSPAQIKFEKKCEERDILYFVADSVEKVEIVLGLPPEKPLTPPPPAP